MYDINQGSTPGPINPPGDWFQAHPPPSTNVNGLVTDQRNAAGRGTSAEQYYRDYIQNFGVKLKQADPAGWSKLVADMRNEGYDVSLDSRPDGMHKGIMMNGQFIKLADGNDNPIWLPGGDAPGGGGGDLGALGAGTLLQPFTENFSREPFKPPPDFVAPTGDQVFEDPGFKFRLDQGRQALERSAAAKGTLLTTGTLKDLDSFSQGAASQEYGNVYARRAGEYESQYGKAVDTYARDYNQALGEYGIKKDNFFTNQDRPFNKLTTLAGFGSSLPPTNYAGQYGSLMMGGANQQGSYLTGAANGQAAGLVGGSNAWTNAFGNLSNLGAQYASIYSNPWNRGPQQQMPWQGAPYR